MVKVSRMIQTEQRTDVMLLCCYVVMCSLSDRDPGEPDVLHRSHGRLV